MRQNITFSKNCLDYEEHKFFLTVILYLIFLKKLVN